ncbi:MAG: nucleotidyltransferase family protein [Candidatus Magnetoovum sp. WYHC-5]|nr:nucleotidyltransferase family protein [Candidatus Magnetoovum sp. WYHC-5]
METIMDIEDIKNILSKHKHIIIERYKVKEIGIFGSYVKGIQTNTSDIDILVDFSEAVSMFEFLELEEYLANMLGVKVDMVSKNALKPYIGSYILKEAIYI